MNPDLILELHPCEDEGHDWVGLEDAYGVELMECERCGIVMVPQ